MPRKLKFANADDLIDNCDVVDGCFIWRHKHGLSIDNPCLAPLSPLAVALQTTTIVRALFITCRFLPASGRLVKWCNTPNCVNPYHHSESRKVVEYRTRQGGQDGTGFYTGLLPDQEKIRHMLPSEAVISQTSPTRPATIKLLIAAAASAGFDCQKLPASKLQQKISNAHRSVASDEPTAPVLVLSSRLTPKRAERTEEEEAALKKESDEWMTTGIFAAIEERKKAKIKKMIADWDE